MSDTNYYTNYFQIFTYKELFKNWPKIHIFQKKKFSYFRTPVDDESDGRSRNASSPQFSLSLMQQESGTRVKLGFTMLLPKNYFFFEKEFINIQLKNPKQKSFNCCFSNCRIIAETN